MTILKRSSSSPFCFLLLLACACAASAPPPETLQSVQYRGETVLIPPVPTSVPDAAGWPLEAFARGDTVVCGYIVASETARRELATAKGIKFRSGGRWSEVEVDWVGLHVLSHEGYVLLEGLRPKVYVHPRIPESVTSAMARDGISEITCTVRVVVDAAGNVLDARISEASGYDSADRSALEAAMGCKYGPASEEGRPVPFKTSVRFTITRR